MATELERLVIRIEADLTKLRSGLRGAEVATKASSSRMSRSFTGVGRTIGGITRQLSSLRGILLTVGAAFTVKEFVQAADTFSLLSSKIKLVTDSEEELTSVTDALFQSSQRTRVGFEETVGLFTRLASSSGELGATQEELLAVTETINQAVIVSGASAATASAGLTQLGQGFASGVLRGEELNSVLENTPRIAQAIADGLGVTIGSLRALGAEGKLTGDLVFGAIQSQAANIADEFGQIERTAGQAFQQLGNAFLRAAGESSKASGAVGNLVEAIDELRFIIESPEFQAGLAGLLEFFVGIATTAAGAIGAVRQFKQEFQRLVPTGALGGPLADRRSLAALGPQFEGPSDAENRIQALRLKQIALSSARGPQVAGALKSTRKLGVTTDEEDLQGPNLPDANAFLTSLRMGTKELQIQLDHFGQSEALIDRQLTLLDARSKLFGKDLETAEKEIAAQARIGMAIEARTKAEEDLQRIKDVQITTNAELVESSLNLQGAATAFAGSVASAFEDAVIAGEDLSDVISALEEDILRLLTRLLITEPLEKGLRTGLGAFQEPAAGGPGGIEGLLGGGLTGLADLFGFEGKGTQKALEKSIGSEIGGAGSEFISGEDAKAIFGDLTDQAGLLGFAFEDAKSAAGRASAALGGDLVSETLLTTGVKATESSITISTTTAVGELGVAATAAAVAISTMTTAAAAGGAGSAATAPGGPIGGALGLLGGFGGSFGGGGGGLDAQIAADVASGFGGIFHGGGVVGSSRVPIRAFPAGTFRGAPRMHQGGIPGLAADELPAILQRGETVIPRDGMGGNTFIFNGVTDFESFRRNRSQLRGIGHEMSDRAEAKDS